MESQFLEIEKNANKGNVVAYFNEQSKKTVFLDMKTVKHMDEVEKDEYA